MTDSVNSGKGPTGPRATFGVRFVAVLIDGVGLGVISLILGLMLPVALYQVVSIALGLGYFVYLEGSPSGQTVGKRLMGIRVIDFTNGQPIDYGKALIRYIGRIVSSIACLLGYLWVLWDPEKQAWHDKIAGTVVVPVSDYPVAAWPG